MSGQEVKDRRADEGEGYQEYVKAMRQRFEKVVVRKPKSSRDESAEQYLLARVLKAA